MTKKNDIERLFKAHYEQMYRLASGLLHDNELARDVVHDVFKALLDEGEEMKDANFKILFTASYLLKAVRNRCLNHIRDCEIHQRIARRYFLENEEYDTEKWPDEETIARIYTVINSSLTPQARRVMELRFNDGMAFSKVAAVMGISETAVYRHLRHALIVIRQNLKENG